MIIEQLYVICDVNSHHSHLIKPFKFSGSFIFSSLMKILHLFTRRMRLPVVVCCAAALHQHQSTMSNLFVKVSPTRGSTLIFVRHWSQKPKPWVYRKPVEYITPHDIFRQRLGLPPKLNQTKELQDYSDYSFHDGRPTPVRPGQLKQIKQQQSLAAAAVVHLKEIKYIVDRDTQRKQHAQNERRHIIESKLKPKGDLLMKEESREQPVNK